MLAKEFISKVSVKKETPNGGIIHIGAGHIVLETGVQIEGIGIKVIDKFNSEVTTFALSSDSFGVFMECIKEVFDRLPK